MELAATKKPWAVFVGVLLGLLFVSAVGLQDPPLFRALWSPQPLHADEAVQWSLAKELSEGVPYSVNADRFHGPTLALSLNAASKLTGTSFTEMSVVYLRNVAGFYLLLLSLAALALPGVSLWSRLTAAAFCLLVGGGAPFGFYFVQEVLLVAGLAWGVVLWLRSEAALSPGGRSFWRLLSGLVFGFALACKVTAAAYLFFFFVALMVVRKPWADRHLAGFLLGLVGSWVTFQSVGFTDVRGLITWWQQLARSFGVASGRSGDTLTAVSYWPWIWAALWLAEFSLQRYLRERFVPFRCSAADFILVFVGLVFLFHLLLPYKTPWLLYGVMALPLVLLLPAQLGGCWRKDGLLLIGLLVSAAYAAGDFADHSKTDRMSLRVFLWRVDDLSDAYKEGKFYIAVEGGHYWPLPYYLRMYPVGYGEFPQAAKAPLRLIPATDASEPVVPGYAVSSLTLREGGDRYWVLVAKGYESVFIGK
jgi:hypothetical protein